MLIFKASQLQSADHDGILNVKLLPIGRSCIIIQNQRGCAFLNSRYEKSKVKAVYDIWGRKIGGGEVLSRFKIRYYNVFVVVR